MTVKGCMPSKRLLLASSICHHRARMELAEAVKRIQRESNIVGRERELEKALAAVRAGKHLMIEGPVGVGKTVLAAAVARHLGRPIFRVDGDERYTEQKLAGWFDPPIVLERGYVPEAFIPGPLTNAMREGGVLFINEMNRMPEGVQNILLPAMDEGVIELPRLGTVRAKDGFVIIGTQNPREFVATTALSEALSDRFELLLLDYQSEAEEIEIVRRQLPDVSHEAIVRSVWIVRRTRNHPSIRRGASIRAAVSIAQLSRVLSSDLFEGIRRAAHMALPMRIEMREESKKTADEVVDEIVNECFSLPPPDSGEPPLARATERSEGSQRKHREIAGDVVQLMGFLETVEPGEQARRDDIGWAIARNYSILRMQLRDPALIDLAKRIAVKATIKHVLRLLGPVSMPTRMTVGEFRPGEDAELDVEATVDEMIERGHTKPEEIVVSRKEPRKAAVVMMLDASLSMTGEKLAMATAAIAVLAFRLKTIDYAIITFNDRPTVVKRLNEARDLDALVSELLDARAGGYTNIDAALRRGHELLLMSKTRDKLGLLVTDGNYTVGEDPSKAASSYRRLFVVMIESHDCQPTVCEGIARAGGGRMFTVSSFEEIPRVLYTVLRRVFQGAPSKTT